MCYFLVSSCFVSERGNTDAYLFSITYPASVKNVTRKEVTDYFMAYGSYIRHSEKTIFSSLSKVYMMLLRKKNHLEIEIQGQPLINAVFQPAHKPCVFILNGEHLVPDYKGGNWIFF